MGVMIGDALGQPVETMSAKDILDKTEGKGIVDFVCPIQRKISDTKNLPAGSTTDDWQMTEAVCKSLVRMNGFDIMDQALVHVEALETSVYGWGSTTKFGLKELKLYFDSRGKEGRHPLVWPDLSKHTKKNIGAGNGVAMQIAPIAIFDYLGGKHSALYRKVQAIACFTHPDMGALNAAHGIARCIKANLNDGNFKFLNFDFDLPLLKDILTHTGSVKPEFDTIDKIVAKTGNSSLAQESVALAIAIHLKYPEDFKTGVLAAVNAGGDTDTVASMVGAMTGARVGLEGIPDEWKNFNPEFQKSIEWGEKLFNLKVA